MARKYTAYKPEFKLKIAIEASQNKKTINEIAAEYNVHPAQVSEWKRQLSESATEVFPGRRRKQDKDLLQNLWLKYMNLAN